MSEYNNTAALHVLHHHTNQDSSPPPPPIPHPNANHHMKCAWEMGAMLGQEEGEGRATGSHVQRTSFAAVPAGMEEMISGREKDDGRHAAAR